ncbi:Uncharacterised protein [Bartonella grahamii]|uniref:Uncharacterized protein n=1 Tax=Bartonella grahamii TaxID=33045 RepID=A0A336NEP6_BARGR|nr:Uncharacterised protein [Bartonella grahamii]
MVDGVTGHLHGRDLHTHQVSFLRLNISHKDKHLTRKIGTLPRGAMILSIKAFVKTAFSDAKLKIGSTYGGNEFSEKDIKTQSTQDFTSPTKKSLFQKIKSLRFMQHGIKQLRLESVLWSCNL